MGVGVPGLGLTPRSAASLRRHRGALGDLGDLRSIPQVTNTPKTPIRAGTCPDPCHPSRALPHLLPLPRGRQCLSVNSRRQQPTLSPHCGRVLSPQVKGTPTRATPQPGFQPPLLQQGRRRDCHVWDPRHKPLLGAFPAQPVVRCGRGLQLYLSTPCRDKWGDRDTSAGQSPAWALSGHDQGGTCPL